MKDFLGNELKVGDSVVAVELAYRNLIKCTVVAITAQKVRLRSDSVEEDVRDPNYGTFLQLPKQIVLAPGN